MDIYVLGIASRTNKNKVRKDATSGFEFAFVLMTLALLCAPVLAQENTTDYWMNEACEFSRNGSFEEAVLAYDRALGIDPKNGTAWVEKAFCLYVLGKEIGAKEAYEKVITLADEGLKQDPTDAKTWQNKAIALSKTRRTDGAEATFNMALVTLDAVLQNDSSDMDLLFLKGRALFKLARYGDAIVVYDQIIETSPNVEPYITATNAWMAKGDALLASGRNKETLNACNKAIELGPHLGSAWQGRGEAQRKLGQVYNATMSLYVAERLGY